MRVLKIVPLNLEICSIIVKEAIKLDPNAKEASEGMNRVMTAKYASRNDPEQVKQRAMNDPEVAQIMGDPSMRMILDQVSHYLRS